MKFLEFLDARSFGLQAAERRFEILKFLAARSFVLQRAAKILNFTPAPSRNGFRNLKFTSVPRNRFEILKFTRASARLVNTAQNFILQNRFKILKFTQELPFAPRRVLPNADKAEAGRAENFSKFDLTGALLNSISLPPRKFKFALLKFTREVPRDRSEILNFTHKLRKFKPASAVRLNFAFNSVLHARAAKFERSAR